MGAPGSPKRTALVALYGTAEAVPFVQRLLPPTLTSQPHLLSQAEEFVLYPPYRALPGRRPDKLRVFLAREAGKRTL